MASPAHVPSRDSAFSSVGGSPYGAGGGGSSGGGSGGGGSSGGSGGGSGGAGGGGGGGGGGAGGGGGHAAALPPMVVRAQIRTRIGEDRIAAVMGDAAARRRFVNGHRDDVEHDPGTAYLPQGVGRFGNEAVRVDDAEHHVDAFAGVFYWHAVDRMTKAKLFFIRGFIETPPLGVNTDASLTHFRSRVSITIPKELHSFRLSKRQLEVMEHIFDLHRCDGMPQLMSCKFINRAEGDAFFQMDGLWFPALVDEHRSLPHDVITSENIDRIICGTPDQLDRLERLGVVLPSRRACVLYDTAMNVWATPRVPRLISQLYKIKMVLIATAARVHDPPHGHDGGGDDDGGDGHGADLGSHIRDGGASGGQGRGRRPVDLHGLAVRLFDGDGRQVAGSPHTPPQRDQRHNIPSGGSPPNTLEYGQGRGRRRDRDADHNATRDGVVYIGGCFLHRCISLQVQAFYAEKVRPGFLAMVFDPDTCWFREEFMTVFDILMRLRPGISNTLRITVDTSTYTTAIEIPSLEFHRLWVQCDCPGIPEMLSCMRPMEESNYKKAARAFTKRI